MDGYPNVNRALLLPESPMQFLPSLAGLIGSDCALFLQQLHYWLKYSQNVYENRRWVYNLLDEWNLQFFFWSKSTLQRVLRKLQNVTINDKTYHLILVAEFNRNAFTHTKWLTINYEALAELSTIAEEVRFARYQKIIGASKSLQTRLPKLVVKYPGLQEFLEKNPVFEEAEKDDAAQEDSREGQNDHIGADAENSDNVKLTTSKIQNESSEVVKMTTSRNGQIDHLEEVKNNLPSIIHKNTIHKNTSSEKPDDDVDIEKKEEGEDSSNEENLATGKSGEAYFLALLKKANIRVYPEDKKSLAELLQQFGALDVERAIITAESFHAKTFHYVETILTTKDAERKGNSHANRTRQPQSAEEAESEKIWSQFHFRDSEAAERAESEKIWSQFHFGNS